MQSYVYLLLITIFTYYYYLRKHKDLIIFCAISMVGVGDPFLAQTQLGRHIPFIIFNQHKTLSSDSAD